MDSVALVTGGSGTLGQSVVKLLLKRGGYSKVVVFGRDEAAQARMSSNSEFRTQKIAFEIGDVTRKESLRLALGRYKVTHVVHAAAMKHVPMAERNPSECIETNIIGSRNVLQASMESGVSTVVLVSTDKAAQPTNTYGLSKALMERLVPEFDGVGGMKVSATRFGNLVGSRGSVLELFLRQIKTSGEVTVTDPNMTRFFIRTTQAADAVAYALRGTAGGLVLVPQMKAAILSDFVKAAIEYSGLTAKIRTVGLRPGEKRHELVMTDEEASKSVEAPEFLGLAIGYKPQSKPAAKAGLSSETAPRMEKEELLGMIAEAAGDPSLA